MKSKVDEFGRILVPKLLRDRLGLAAGTVVDLTLSGDGLDVAVTGPTARIERHDGKLVAVSDTAVSDAEVLDLIDSVRR